jgi:2-oxoglutarate dehydrogenase E2 component (dihydrolipoamide succinyltransferase)
MAIDVVIPDLGESVTEAILVEWLKKEGDSVALDEPLCVLETDKADVELPAPEAGVLKQIKSSGDTIQVGEAIARIEEGGAAPAASAPEKEETAAPAATAPEEKAGGNDLSPAVRRLVTENDLDPSAITGTGKSGRLTKSDVLNHLEKPKADAPAKPAFASGYPVPVPAPAVAEVTPEPAEGEAGFDAKGVKRVPMTRLRKKIAERLVSAQHSAAMLTTFNEVDMTGVFEIRTKYKERFQEVHGVSLGLMSFFVRASVLALLEFENVNASLEGEDILYHRDVHMGIAVSTERGLVVPILKNTQALSFDGIEGEIKRVALAAREGKLGINELSGGTFTITNGGVFGSMLSTPILNPPQTGILGMHAIQKRPIAVGDEVQIRPMMYLALTYDHRLVDGKESVSFLVRLKQLLEDPARMMLGV